MQLLRLPVKPAVYRTEYDLHDQLSDNVELGSASQLQNCVAVPHVIVPHITITRIAVLMSLSWCHCTSTFGAFDSALPKKLALLPQTQPAT